MASGLIIIPNYMPALNRNGVPCAGAKMYFYQNDSSVPKLVYQNRALTVPHSQPVVADSAGVFPAIYADTTALYNVAVTTAADIPLSPVYEGVSASTTVIEAIASTDYTTIAQAAAANIDAAVHRIRTLYYAPNYAIPITMSGGAEYRPVDLADLTGYPASSYFQSADGRYWVLDDKENINPDALGAIRDDTTDCTTAFNDACTLANLTHLPVTPRAGGTYYGLGPFNTLEMGQSVIGEKGCRIRTPNGFVTVNPTATTSPQMWAVSTFRDIWFIPTGVGTSAINVYSTFSNTSSPGRITGAYIEDCKFAVADESLISGFRSSPYDYWADAIHLTSVALGRISNCFIAGGFEITSGGYVPGRENTTGIRIDGNSIRLDIDKGCNIQSCGYGIYVTGTVEGFSIDGNEVIYCRRSIHIDTTSQGGATRIRQLHLNCSERGIYIKNRKVFDISEVNVWRGTYESRPDWAGIELDTCVDFDILGFKTNPSGLTVTSYGIKATNCSRFTLDALLIKFNTYGVYLASCTDVTLDNISGEQNTIGIFADANCDNINVGAYRFPNAASTPLSISSSATNIYYNVRTGRPDGSATTINAAGSETVTSATGFRRLQFNAQAGGAATSPYTYTINLGATGAQVGDVVTLSLRISTPYALVNVLDNVGAIQQVVSAGAGNAAWEVTARWNGGSWRTLCREVEYSAVVQSGSASAYVGQVATGCIVPSASTTSLQQTMSYSPHVAQDNISYTSVGFANWYVDVAALTELAPAGATSITASIEYPVGTFTQLLFSGNATGSIASGATLFSDFANVGIPKGAVFGVRTWTSNAGGIVQTTGECIQLGEKYQKGTVVTDKTMGGTITSTSAGSGEAYKPVAIIATTKRPSFFLVGDSITAGAIDVPNDKTGNWGSLARRLGDSYPYICVARGGDRASIAKGNFTKRLALLAYCSHVINALGSNDIYIAGSSSATLQADLATLNGLFGNKPIYGCTVTPNTTSTDGWITVANQTVKAQEAIRTSFNDTRRDGLPSENGVIDMADSVENERNGGKWAIHGAAQRLTGDGLHPNATGGRIQKRSAIWDLTRFET